jgi:hypothetical protein
MEKKKNKKEAWIKSENMYTLNPGIEVCPAHHRCLIQGSELWDSLKPPGGTSELWPLEALPLGMGIRHTPYYKAFCDTSCFS